MRIAIDAMGGDFAPREIVLGVVEGLALVTDADELILVGRQEAIEEHLPRDESIRRRLKIVHAPDVIEMDDPPVEAVRAKKHSSIMVMAKMAAQGEVDGIISAGNTGAFAAACQLRLRTLGNVQRPGIAVALPTFAGPVTICDAGANVQPKPQHLLQYAQMATAYSESVLKIAKPRVGLMSIGGEDVKGSPLVKQTHALLKQDTSLNFIGNVEGRDLFAGACDVAVCDGFVGNVVLKLTEGLAEGLFRTIRNEIKAASPELASSFEPVVKAIWARHDYSEYGGAPLLGVDGVCLICHGSSNARTIKNAIRVTRDFISSNLIKIMSERLTEVGQNA
jgi:phosphate acyltransferase